MATIVVADDHEITRAGVRQIVCTRSELELVAEARDGLEAIALVKRHKPDVLILDVSMPHAGAMEVQIEIARWSPNTKVIIFTGFDSGKLLSEIISNGATAIVSKSEDTTALYDAIDCALLGKKFVSERIKQILEGSELADSLSSREKQVLMLISNGKSNREIAEILSLSAKTVDNHRSRIMQKLNLHSISELMSYAFKNGLITN